MRGLSITYIAYKEEVTVKQHAKSLLFTCLVLIVGMAATAAFQPSTVPKMVYN
jgi:hypothetical protein